MRLHSNSSHVPYKEVKIPMSLLQGVGSLFSGVRYYSQTYRRAQSILGQNFTSLAYGNVPVNSKTAHAPPGQTPGHLTFLKNFGQIPCYVASLHGQMPHPLELQRGSNPPPSRHVKQTVETSAKFSATTNFLFSLSSLHTLNKGIFHDRSI